MTDHDDRDLEQLLRQFRPAGPPASMKAPAVLTGRRADSTPHRLRPLLLGGGALAAAAVVVVFAWANRPASDTPAASRADAALTLAVSDVERQAFEAHWRARPRVAFGLSDAGADVVMVEFVDWLCPAQSCRMSAARAVADRYAVDRAGAVRYLASDFPINAECNPAVATTIRGHEASCVAAAAVRLTRAGGRDRAMIDWLGTAVGITSVPHLYINGASARDGGSAWSAEYIDMAVQLELASGRSAPGAAAGRQSFEAPVRVGGDIGAARLTRTVEPLYPVDPADGIVAILELTVEPAGRVSDVRVLRAPQGDDITRAAIDAVRQWEYEPLELGGVPVWFMQTVVVD